MRPDHEIGSGDWKKVARYYCLHCVLNVPPNLMINRPLPASLRSGIKSGIDPNAMPPLLPRQSQAQNLDLAEMEHRRSEALLTRDGRRRATNTWEPPRTIHIFPPSQPCSGLIPFGAPGVAPTPTLSSQL